MENFKELSVLERCMIKRFLSFENAKKVFEVLLMSIIGIVLGVALNVYLSAQLEVPFDKEKLQYLFLVVPLASYAYLIYHFSLSTEKERLKHVLKLKHFNQGEDVLLEKGAEKTMKELNGKSSSINSGIESILNIDATLRIVCLLLMILSPAKAIFCLFILISFGFSYGLNALKINNFWIKKELGEEE